MFDALLEFENRLPTDKREILQSYRAPIDIQNYLDTQVKYVAEERDRCPLDVMRDGQGHCLDGGFFAALALRRLGFSSIVVDLVPESGLDDDHVLAVFRGMNGWGAVAKSNFTGLRYREPVYRTVRELCMSYFQNYFNVERQRTLRGYLRPFALERFDETGWMWNEAAANRVYRRFYARKPILLISAEAAGKLTPLDEFTYKGDTINLDYDWVFGRRHNP